MAAVTPASNREAAKSQPRLIGRRAPPRDVAPLLLLDRCCAVEECLASFIDIAAGSYVNDPKRSTYHSEPTSPSAIDFDRDALSFRIQSEGNIRVVSLG
jgi:hypothetical protein